MSIFTHDGRAALAKLVLSRPLHLALGDGGDDVPLPPLDYDAHFLRREIGRKAASRVLHVFPDENGILVLPGGKKYSMSETPTRHLYMEFLFDYNEGVGSAVREIGLFMDTRPIPDQPQGKTYFLPNESEDRGVLLLLEYPENPDIYNPQKKGSYEIVLSF